MLRRNAGDVLVANPQNDFSARNALFNPCSRLALATVAAQERGGVAISMNMCCSAAAAKTTEIGKKDIFSTSAYGLSANAPGNG